MESSPQATAPPQPWQAPAFDTLVAQTIDDLFRLAVRLTGSRADADDVVQVAYLRAHEALTKGTFRGESRVETWLYRIVTHVAFDSRRERRRRDGLTMPTSGVVPDVAEAAVELGELREALELLPVDQRTALVLRELQGLTGKQTAEVMDRSEGSVEQLLVRARATLRERFDR